MMVIVRAGGCSSTCRSSCGVWPSRRQYSYSFQ